MYNVYENKGNRLQYWGLTFLLATMLIIIGYKTPIVWLSVSTTIWTGYIISFIASPLLVAASQNTRIAKTATRVLSVLGTIAIAALISAPIIMFHWYRVTYH
jgi:hypothetical protein